MLRLGRREASLDVLRSTCCCCTSGDAGSKKYEPRRFSLDGEGDSMIVECDVGIDGRKPSNSALRPPRKSEAVDSAEAARTRAGRPAPPNDNDPLPS